MQSGPNTTSGQRTSCHGLTRAMICPAIAMPVLMFSPDQTPDTRLVLTTALDIWLNLYMSSTSTGSSRRRTRAADRQVVTWGQESSADDSRNGRSSCEAGQRCGVPKRISNRRAHSLRGPWAHRARIAPMPRGSAPIPSARSLANTRRSHSRVSRFTGLRAVEGASPSFLRSISGSVALRDRGEQRRLTSRGSESSAAPPTGFRGRRMF